MMRVLEGQVPAAAQQGLKDTLKPQNDFLSCSCQPAEDLAVALPNDGARMAAFLQSIDPLNEEIICIGLHCEKADAFAIPPPEKYNPGCPSRGFYMHGSFG